MKKYSLLIPSICLAFSLCLIPKAIFAADYQTLTQEEEYYQTLYKLFSEAATSIDIVIDIIVADPMDLQNPVNKLIDVLVEARKRGVKVRVVFEDSRSVENLASYKSLLENGIDVYFDTSKQLINSESIVVDSKKCIIGSISWSPVSFGKNYAMSIVLDSEEMAKTIADSISKVTLAERPLIAEESLKGVLIPDDFLLLKDFGIRFVKEKANKPFDLYLVLIHEAQDQGNDEFNIDHEKIGRLLCLEKEVIKKLNDKEKKDYYNKRIRKILIVPERRYGFLQYHRKDNKVVLLEKFDIDLSKPEANNLCFILPDKFWEAGFSSRLNLNEKYLYLISLREAKKSTRSPYWFSNEYILSNLYGLGDYAISKGLQRLAEENLIEIVYAPFIKGEPPKEKRNIYCINKIITEDEFNRSVEDLRSKYGQDITAKAQAEASELGEPKDIFVIEVFINLIKKYGYPAVRHANAIALSHEIGSNLRHISTTIKILEKE